MDQGSPSSQGTMAKARQAVPRTQRRREPYPMERSHFRAPAEGPVTGLDVQATCDIDPQAGADCAPGLGVLFEVFGVPADMCLQKLAEQILLHAKCHNRLQLGISLLQLLVASLDGRGNTSILSSLMRTITPFGKGTHAQGTKVRQRDLLPLPLPAFGALLNLVKKLKRLCVLVLNGENSSWLKLVPAGDHIETQSQRAALAGLSRRYAWWPGQPLEARAEASVTDLISARHVDYSGDAVLKALPLRLEELAPGLPEDGVAGSLDA